MTTWTTIFPDVDGSPVRGEPSEFRTTARFFSTLAEQTRSIVDEFARFADDGQASGSLEGETGKAFGDFIEEVDSSLSELPEVSGNAADIFEQHVEELSRLREWAETGADSALARARTAWNTKTDLEGDAVQLRRSHDAIMRQIDQVDASDDGTGASDPERSNLDDARGRNADSLRLTEQGIAEQERILARIRSEWSDIRAAERRLDDKTISDLDDIRLGDLEDPGFWDKIVSGAFDLMITLGTIAIGVMCPLVGLYMLYGGDWAAMLWDLKEILDVVLVVAGVVALFFPLTAPFVIAIAALSLLALAVTATLYATQAPNPQTGETVGLGDVLWSAAGVAFSSANSLKALRALRGTGTFTPMSGITSMRTNVTNWHSVLRSGENATGGGSRPRDPHGAAGTRDEPGQQHRRGRPFAWRAVGDCPRRRTPSAVTSGGPARCWACPTAPPRRGRPQPDPGTQHRRVHRHRRARAVQSAVALEQRDPSRRPRAAHRPGKLTPNRPSGAPMARASDYDSIGIGLPREWVTLPIEQRAFEKMCDDLRKRWREDPDWDRSTERRAELLLARIRAEMRKVGIKAAAMYVESFGETSADAEADGRRRRRRRGADGHGHVRHLHPRRSRDEAAVDARQPGRRLLRSAPAHPRVQADHQPRAACPVRTASRDVDPPPPAVRAREAGPPARPLLRRVVRVAPRRRPRGVRDPQLRHDQHRPVAELHACCSRRSPTR